MAQVGNPPPLVGTEAATGATRWRLRFGGGAVVGVVVAAVVAGAVVCVVVVRGFGFGLGLG
jgi:hypothetical protein